MLETARRTPLHDLHVRAEAKMVPFAGYLMPVEYAGILKEHERVRTGCGLFDLSHMAEFRLQGPGALEFLQGLVTNDLARLSRGQALYTVICNPEGGVLDDVIAYSLPDYFLLVVNAGNRAKIAQWLRSRLPKEVTFEDESDSTALLALQGPRSEELLQKHTPLRLSDLAYYSAAATEVEGLPALVARTGYTGEDGFELYVSNGDGSTLWQKLLSDHESEGLRPCGLGARDTLRLEAGYPLYGHELGEDITPIEAGLSWVVKWDKGDFVGKESLARVKDAPPRRLIGLTLEKGIPREGYPVLLDGQPAGGVTSGTFSPTLRKGIAVAYVETPLLGKNKAVEVEIRGKPFPGSLVKLPFYRGSVKRK
ncbi:MAG: glycine cleavage system aminomethyltransferase GcvT [Armatimonadetes bacterium]|nr:glycine cleavage system aminomethyltransferase GcvT [Armatimonadota bacterium]